MEAQDAVDVVTRALVFALVLAAPILGIGLLVGLVVGIGQALTQLQEQALSFVPKIIAMAAATAFFMPWLAKRAVEYASELWSITP